LEGSFWGLVERYNALDGSLGQIVRRHLISRGLDAHLPPPPARVLDVGGGAGQQSIPLAGAGHEVTILDPSREMLAEARRRLGRERAAVRRRVRLVEGIGERASRILGTQQFDAVLCHGVVMYLEDPYLCCLGPSQTSHVRAAWSPYWRRTPLHSPYGPRSRGATGKHSPCSTRTGPPDVWAW